MTKNNSLYHENVAFFKRVIANNELIEIRISKPKSNKWINVRWDYCNESEIRQMCFFEYHKDVGKLSYER